MTSYLSLIRRCFDCLNRQTASNPFAAYYKTKTANNGEDLHVGETVSRGGGIETVSSGGGSETVSTPLDTDDEDETILDSIDIEGFKRIDKSTQTEEEDFAVSKKGKLKQRISKFFRGLTCRRVDVEEQDEVEQEVYARETKEEEVTVNLDFKLLEQCRKGTDELAEEDILKKI